MVNLKFILDYIYHGEVSIFQEQLDSFLEIAQKLEVEGLFGEDKEKSKMFLDQNDEDFHQQPIEEKKMVKLGDSIARRKQPKPRVSHNSIQNETMFDVSSMTSEEIEEKKMNLLRKEVGSGGA